MKQAASKALVSFLAHSSTLSSSWPAFQPWWWRQYVPLKHWTYARPYSISCLKTHLFIVIAVITSNAVYIYCSLSLKNAISFYCYQPIKNSFNSACSNMNCLLTSQERWAERWLDLWLCDWGVLNEKENKVWFIQFYPLQLYFGMAIT
jgi:hypothetical protein